MFVCSAVACLCTTYVQYPKQPEEGIRSSRTSVWMAVSCLTGPSRRAAPALNHRTISLDQTL